MDSSIQPASRWELIDAIALVAGDQPLPESIENSFQSVQAASTQLVIQKSQNPYQLGF
jgi:hypothetical protein